MDFANDKHSELEMMLDIINDKTSFLGPRIQSDLLISAFPFLEDQSNLSISNWVINLVHQSLSNFLNPIVERPRLVSKKIMGRIMVDQTIQHIHQLNFVSNRAKINPITLPRLLIARFSILMINELNEIKKNFPDDVKPNDIKLGRKINKNIANHKLHLSMLESQIPNIVELSLDTNFFDQLVLDKTEQQAKGGSSILDLIYLWKIYIAGRSLSPNLKKSLDGGLTLLPMSKLYELLVLVTILEFMKKKFGSYSLQKKDKGETGQTFKFRKKVKLHYNKPSNFSPWDGGGFGSLRPDFMLEYDDRILAIFDAKYKQKNDVDAKDYQKMLEYILRFCGTSYNKVEQSGSDTNIVFSKLVGLFFYIGNKSDEESLNKIQRKSPEASIEKEMHRIPITKELNSIKDILNKCII